MQRQIYNLGLAWDAKKVEFAEMIEGKITASGRVAAAIALAASAVVLLHEDTSNAAGSQCEPLSTVMTDTIECE